MPRAISLHTPGPTSVLYEQVKPIYVNPIHHCLWFHRSTGTFYQLFYHKAGQLKNALFDILTQEVEPRGAEKEAGDNLEGATNLFQGHKSPKHKEFYN